MRILVVTHYFPPEVGAPQARLSELARFWAEAGEQVTVLTGMPNHPTGIVHDGYRGALRRIEGVDGYRVVRTWLYATPNEGIARKTLGHISFMLSAPLLGWRASGPADVVVVSSPTFFSIFAAWALARLRRARLVVEVRDLWPAIFVELGVLTNRFVIRALEAVELAAYRAAEQVVVVTEGFRDDLVRRGVPPSKVHTIRNGADLERFAPTDGEEAERSRTRAALGAGPDDVLVLYAGAHGISHGLVTVAEAAAILDREQSPEPSGDRVGDVTDEPACPSPATPPTQATPRVRFAFVGDGAAKAELAARVRALGVGNVELLPAVPREQVPGLLRAADICLVPLRDVPLFSSFIPSKIFEYLGAGKAVVGSVRGEPARILTDAGAVVVGPEDPQALATAIAEMAADKAQRDRMGMKGRAWVERNADRRALAERYRSLLASTVAGDASRPLG